MARDIQEIVDGDSELKGIVEMRLLSFTFSAISHLDSRYFSTGFTDVVAPFRALGGVRAQRALFDVDRAQLAVNGAGGCRVIIVPSSRPSLPLAWVLSDKSYGIIEQLSGLKKMTEGSTLEQDLRIETRENSKGSHPNIHCESTGNALGDGTVLQFVSDNERTFKLIENDLSGPAR